MHIWYGAFGRQHCMNIHHDSLEPREFLWCPSTSIALFYFPKHWTPSDWQWDIHLLQVWLLQLCITQRHKLSDKLVYILELITTAETLESWNKFSHLGWQLCCGNPFAQRGLNAVSKLKHQNGLTVRPTTMRHADSWSSSADSQTAGICCSENMTSNDISWTDFKGIQYRSSLRWTECFVYIKKSQPINLWTQRYLWHLLHQLFWIERVRQVH